jgi:cytochrome oxidase Cu insertion factor (SCO1/SenC/PrrC family)
MPTIKEEIEKMYETAVFVQTYTVRGNEFHMYKVDNTANIYFTLHEGKLLGFTSREECNEFASKNHK